MKKLTHESRLAGGFALALVLLLLAGAEMYKTLHEYMATTRWVAHTYQVLDALGEVTSGMRELESGQRAYMLADDESFLARRDVEISQVHSALARVGELTVDNTRQQLRYATLTQLVAERLQLLDTTTNEYRAEGLEAARAIIRTGVSRSMMDTLEKKIGEMDEEERSLLRQRSDEAEQNAHQALAVGALLVALAMAGFVLFWWRTRSEALSRQLAEAAVHANERLLTQVLELIPVGVFIADAGGKLNRINPAARDIWAAGRSSTPERFSEYSGWWPDSGKAIAAEEWPLARTLRSGETVRDELTDIRCFDGSRKTIASSSMPIHDDTGRIVGGLAVNVDITEFKRTERKLRATVHANETQGRALSLFSASFDRRKVLEGLLAMLAEREPFPVSALYGLDEWSGQFRCEAAHGLGGDMLREFKLGEGLLGQAAQAEKTVALDASGLTLQTGIADFTPAQVLMIPVGYQERRLAVLVLAASRPITEAERESMERLAAQLGIALHNLRQYSDLKLLAERLRSSSEEISSKNQQLEEASRMKSEFLANMSHELRTPLNAIIGFSEVLKDGLVGELTPRQTESITDIFTSGNHLLSLINDILDLSKVEAGKMTLDLESLPVAELVRGGLQVVREKAMTARLRLSAEVADDLGDIWLDQRKFKQILYNLLSNAVKFTPEGGQVRMVARRVERESVMGEGMGPYLELTVSDSGIGISEEDQKRLFQPFVQIDSTLARRHEGTGLGLTMVKRLAELHGGSIALHSVPGSGSTFTVWLPWRTAAAIPAGAPERITQAMPAPVAEGSRHLALVIEDDDKAAELVRMQLDGAGFRVVRAASAEAGMDMALKERPDLVALDILLPGMDGWEFLERFKQQPEFAAVPVVIISIVADKNRGLSLGASHVLQKPVSREEMTSALAAVGFVASGDGKPRTVLVVDDDPKAVQLIGDYLDAAGHRVLSAFGGQDGIDTARRRLPDLIVLDLMMPEVNGFDVAEALKKDLATATIPIIIVTSKQLTSEERTRINGDVMQVIEKSDFNHGRFIGEVRRAMAGKGK